VVLWEAEELTKLKVSRKILNEKVLAEVVAVGMRSMRAGKSAVV
jgi:hypothetical protein